MLSRNEISELQSEYHLTEKQIQVLQRIQDDEVSRTYFFQNKNDLFWFEPLKYLGFFEPETYQPKPKILENGSTILINWDLLYYFDNITQGQEFNTSNYFQVEIINFIKKVSEFNFNNNLHNSYTYYLFAKFLTRINKNLVSIKTINLIKGWINQTQQDMLITSEITQNLIKKFICENCSNKDVLKGERILRILLKVKKRIQSKPYYSGYVNFEIVGDNYWVNELFNDEDFLNIFSDKFTFSFYSFLKTEMNKALIVNKNVYYVDCIDGMIEVNMVANLPNINFKIYFIKNLTSNERRYDFIKDVKRNKKLLLKFKSKVTSKNETISSLFHNLIEIDNNLFQKDTDVKNLSYSIYSSLFSRKTYESLYDDTHDVNYDALNLYSKILKKIILTKSNSELIYNIKLTKQILGDLINDEYFYFIKLFLYIVAKSKIDYSELFWKNIQKENLNGVIFEGIFFGDELKHFFKKLQNLNQKQIKLLKKYFERGPELKDSDETYILQWKQRLYAALKHIPVFEAKYKDYINKSKIEYVLNPAFSPISSFDYLEENTGISPFTDEEILNMSSAEIVEKAKRLENEKSQENNKYLNGLLQTLRRLIIQNPEKFFNDLKPFIDSPISMISTIFLSFQDLNRSNTNFQIGEFNEFVQSLLDLYDRKEELLMDTQRRKMSPYSIFYDIYSSIRELMRNRNIELDKKSNEDIRIILLKLLEYRDQLKGEIDNLENEDYWNISINTPIGNIIEAYILCLRNLTLKEEKDITVKWKKEDRDLFKNLLKEEVIQMYSMFGYHINLFIWFDKKWSFSYLIKSNKLIESDKLVLWKAFMNGYMWNSRVFIDLFNVMLDNYENLSNIKINDNNHSRKNLAIHLSVGYLNDYENLNSGLFSKLLESTKDTQNIINYFWAIKDDIVFNNYFLENDYFKKSCCQRIKVLKFWRHLFKRFESFSGRDFTTEEKEILSDLSRLTYYLFEINKNNYEWLNQIVPYTYLTYNNTYFIEALNLLKDKGESIFVADKLGEIFINLLKYSDPPSIPTYKKEDILSLIKFINDQGFEKKVIEILDFYVDKKYYEFAKDIRNYIKK